MNFDEGLNTAKVNFETAAKNANLGSAPICANFPASLNLELGTLQTTLSQNSAQAITDLKASKMTPAAQFCHDKAKDLDAKYKKFVTDLRPVETRIAQMMDNSPKALEANPKFKDALTAFKLAIQKHTGSNPVTRRKFELIENYIKLYEQVVMRHSTVDYASMSDVLCQLHQ